MKIPLSNFLYFTFFIFAIFLFYSFIQERLFYQSGERKIPNPSKIAYSREFASFPSSGKEGEPIFESISLQDTTHQRTTVLCIPDIERDLKRLKVSFSLHEKEYLTFRETNRAELNKINKKIGVLREDVNRFEDSINHLNMALSGISASLPVQIPKLDENKNTSSRQHQESNTQDRKNHALFAYLTTILFIFSGIFTAILIILPKIWKNQLSKINAGKNSFTLT